jgi:hypothetical protein
MADSMRSITSEFVPILSYRPTNSHFPRHFLAMREIIIWCLELEVTPQQVDALEQMVYEWVREYER